MKYGVAVLNTIFKALISKWALSKPEIENNKDLWLQIVKIPPSKV